MGPSVSFYFLLLLEINPLINLFLQNGLAFSVLQSEVFEPKFELF